MKVVILAGGLGTRFLEVTKNIPKPLIPIGGQPILHHVMAHYAHYGFHEFIIALGYKSALIREYFNNYQPKNWKITLVDTGLETQSGGRLKQLTPYLQDPFHLTWADGLSDIPLKDLVKFHRQHGKLATVTAVRPPLRFGYLRLQDHLVVHYEEKPKEWERWVSGAFFIFEPKVLDYIKDDATPLEKGPLPELAREHQLAAYRHESFWQCMDTLYDHHTLEELWRSGKAPWKVSE